MLQHRHEEFKGSEHKVRAKHVHKDDAHGALDPHVWVSPPEVRSLPETSWKPSWESTLRTIRLTSQSRRFHHRDRKNSTRISRRFSKTRKASNSWFTTPRWGYLARAYGWNRRPWRWRAKEPNRNRLKSLIEESRKQGIKVIFVCQPQFSTKSGRPLRERSADRWSLQTTCARTGKEILREQAKQLKETSRGQAIRPTPLLLVENDLTE